MDLTWPPPAEARALLAVGTTLVLVFDLDAPDPHGLQAAPAGTGPRDALLSAGERAAVGRMRTAALRRRSSRRLAWRRLLLADVLDVAPAEIDFARDACTSCGDQHGRPFLERPRDTGLDFSASSSAHVGLLAVRAGGRVGVDVELVDDAPMPTDETWLSGEEVSAIVRAADPRRARLRAWVRKEACVKATGEGLNVELTEVSVLDEGSATPVHRGMTLRDLSPLPHALGAVAGPGLGPVALARAPRGPMEPSS